MKVLYKIAFALAFPGAILAYGVTLTTFALPSIASYSSAAFSEHSARAGRILKKEAQQTYPEKPTAPSPSFQSARDRAKNEGTQP